MSQTEARYRIQSLKKRYVGLRVAEILLLAAAVFLLISTVASMFTSDTIYIVFPALVSAGIVVAFFSVRYKLNKLTPQQFAGYLNQQYPQLEQSADLFLKDSNELNTLQQLQLQKTINRFDALYPAIKLPNALARSAVVFLVCALLFAGSSFLPHHQATLSVEPELQNIGQTKNTEIAFIKQLQVAVRPPAYTLLKIHKASTPNLTIPEGSSVTWTAVFSSPVEKAMLVLSGKDSLELKNTETASITRTIEESGFYQIQWKTQGKIISSDFYKIEVIKDQAPKISVDNLNQFAKLAFTDNLLVQVKSTLADDYGLTDARVIATVSKGSGESVKFREEKLRFEKPDKITGKKVQGEITLNLLRLGLEPGDELYFYVEAEDNREPVKNRNRTETFFIALQDTAKIEMVEDEGLGVDLMPDYFRSQRQLIIDTEKLLSQKKKLNKQQFNSTSNELGYDQKVLRLRYGQFMGEEFEDQIGEAVAEDDHTHVDETPEDIAKRFGHQHDKENEHNLVSEKKPANTHNHNHEKKNENEQEDLLAAFTHSHDDSETATFFIESVRAKLKAALTVMWDAELQLRLYEPEKSLPYQYTALKLLKEISNDSRIYVHRTGFDPPPLKEEKRLTGDLSEIKNSNVTNTQTEPDTQPAIRAALRTTELLLSNTRRISEAQRMQYKQAGQELAIIVLREPGKYLEGLSVLKDLSEGLLQEQEEKERLLKARKIFWQVLPPQPAKAGKPTTTLHLLDQQFIQQHESLNR